MTTPERSRNRRALLIGAGAAAAVGAGVFALRPRDQGAGGHDAYFSQIARALAEAGLARPTLVVDRARMLANADVAAAALVASGLALRLVVKSLPAFGLLDPLAERLRTQRYMVFNGGMLREMIARRPGADMLMGKPLPAAEAAPIIAGAHGSAPALQWLIDSVERLEAYAAIARAHNAPIKVSFEIDVGLHRGGFENADALRAAVRAAKAEPLVQVAGLMGYDPHVVKVPDKRGAFTRVQALYREAIAVLTSELGGDGAAFTLNTAGSPTYTLHARGTAANEVSVGSAFVKPLDFDLDTLSQHQPAAFIATPVIKALDRARVPGLEPLTGMFSFWDPNSARAFFIYGGHWLAQPVSPPGLRYNSIYGRSSNQEMLTGSRKVNLAAGDYVFLRPTQSEAVFLQFGPIAVYEGGRITHMIETFPVSA